MMSVRRALLCAVLSISLTGCGAAVWTETASGPPRGDIDGAVLTYALASGTLNIVADLKSNELTLSADQKVTAKPDPANVYSLVYNHSSISEDDINIQMDTGMVKSIATTTTDKSVQIVQNVTSLLSQISATQTAIQKAAAPKFIEEKPATTQTCADMQSTYVKNITHNTGQSYITKPGSADCIIVFRVDERPASRKLFGVVGFPRSGDSEMTVPDICDQTYAFCFRLGGLYEIRVRAYAAKRVGTKLTAVTKEVRLPPFTVAAPVAGRLGYVRFDRRAFVSNKAGITFDSAGLVSGFSATNPSEVLGFITLPTAIAAGIAAGVALH
jgi:hypothetical protein